MKQEDEKLFEAAESGDADAARAALGAGADQNARNEYQETPLHFAARNGHTDIARMLIEHGADINAKDFQGQMPRDWAVDAKAHDIIALLKDAAEIAWHHAIAFPRNDDEKRQR